MGTHPIFLDINGKREFIVKLCHELQESWVSDIPITSFKEVIIGKKSF